MPTPDTSGLPPWAEFNDLKVKINEIVAKYNNLLVNLDSLNVVSLTADHIDAGTIDANKVTIRDYLNNGGFIQIDGSGMTVNNGSFDTFDVSIDGAVTMTSALIRSETGYPRVTMDPSSHIFSAETSATNNIKIEAEYFVSNAPSIVFTSGSLETSFGYQPILGLTLLSDSQISVGTTQDMVVDVDELNLLSTNQITVSNFSQIFNNALAQTLQQVLDAKANRSEAGYNLTFDTTSRNLKMFNRDGAQLAIVNIP